MKVPIGNAAMRQSTKYCRTSKKSMKVPIGNAAVDKKSSHL
jgi:hypothetical protein